MPLSEKHRNSKNLDYVQDLFLVFETMAQSRQVFGITELAQRLGWSTSKTFRIIATLDAIGYLRKDPHSRKYRLGIRFWELGCAAVDSLDLREVARPFLENLMKKTLETAVLGVLNNYDVVLIERVETTRAIKIGITIGERVAARVSAIGKAILAFRDSQLIIEANRKWAQEGDVSFNIEEFRNELQSVRTQGFSLNIGKWQKEIGSIGAAIFDHTNQVIAGLSITGPVDHFKRSSLDVLSREVKEAAENVSRNLGAKERTPVKERTLRRGN